MNILYVYVNSLCACVEDVYFLSVRRDTNR